jgi:epoxyqueuosine reductase
VARYAWGRDYHEVIKERLFGLRRELEEELGVRIKARGFTDAVPLLERSAAQHAGLGFFGRNSCLINDRVGSYFFIADLIVDLELEPDTPGTGTCGRCTRCMDRCPTGAIKAPGVVDARLCISYLTIENRGEIPRDLRPLVGDWAFGCDVCQEVCPYNKRKATRSRWPEFSEESGAGPYLEIEEVLGIRSGEDFERRFAGTPLTRPGRAGMLRNCCVVAGNLKLQRAVPALIECLREDPSPLVRGHAAAHLQLAVHARGGADQHRLRQVRGEDADTPAGQQGEVLAQQQRDAVGLLPAGAGGGPDDERARGGPALDHLRQEDLPERLVGVDVAEERRLVGRHRLHDLGVEATAR